MSVLHQALAKAYRNHESGVVAVGPGTRLPAPHAPFGAPAPLSQGPIRQPAPPAAPATIEPFQPVFEVQRFDWPEIVTALAAAAAGELSSYVAAWMGQGPLAPRVLLVSGSRKQEGRTTLSLLLARLFARRGVKTVMVDADFDQPQLAERLDVLPQAGWEHVLEGALPLAEAMIESVQDRMSLLPLLRPLASELKDPQRIAATIEELSRRYDVVCLDGGPCDSSDAVLGALDRLNRSVSAAVLMVRDVRTTAPNECRTLGARLARQGITGWDIVENFVRA
jgi:Mrp family chromosome partitioning ATPase